MFTLRELEAAREVVGRAVDPTPQYAWPLLRARYGVEVWVKHENHTPIGAFKVRGGLTFLDRLHRSGRLPEGFITATRGNHGQSIPFAARRYGVPVTVFVPEGNSEEKNRAMRAWGAEVVVGGRDFDEAREACMRVAVERQLAFVPSFHPDLVLGVATYGLELFTAVPDLHTVYVPIGMGSGVCALLKVRALLGLDVRIVGVVSSGAPAYARSFAAGSPVETSAARTFADGVAVRVPDTAALEMIRAGVDRIVEVADSAVAEAIRVLWQDTHNVAEGAGAIALAALAHDLSRDAGRFGGRPVAVVQTGGNIDTAVLASVLAGQTPDA